MLNYLASIIKTLATEDTQVFSDLPGLKINGTTIPTDIFVLSGEGSRPDLVLLNRADKKCY